MSIINLLLFFLIISVVVFVHELGHFLMAKWNGVTVHEFAIGMGPVLYSREKNGTRYSVRAIPIGGFVSMEGENEESDEQGSFTQKSPLARLGILLAGVFNNFVLGFLLILLFFSLTGTITNVVLVAGNDTPAYRAGILDGDRIVEINQEKIEKWSEVIQQISSSEDGALEVSIVRERAGAKENMRIRIQAEREAETGRWLIGVRPKPVKEFGSVFSQTVTVFLGMFAGIFELLRNIFKPEVTKDLVGPIGLYKVVDDVRQMGLVNLIYLTGFISINIGVINLLPIPAFDGGRSLMVIAEMITGKRLNRKLENTLVIIGFMFILFLVVLTFYNDITRLFVR
ncbi:MAG: site-2 protease family protein [Bacillota bacterium]|nr:site-2 protease family protein [Bacillota bacterium]